MKYAISALLVSAGWASALKQQCSGTATNEGGNWFCGAVEQIIYQGIKGSGKFKAVTHMGAAGECTFEEQPYGGPLAPLDEGLSIHVRGPIFFAEFAVYNLASKDTAKQDADTEVKKEAKVPKVAARTGHKHGHKHLHRHQRAKRNMVFANMNGKEVSWENNWFGGAPANKDSAPSPQTPAVEAAVGISLKSPNAKSGDTSDTGGSSSLSKPKTKPAPSGSDWDRVAYYNAKNKTAENVVFMGNYGGSGSGVFDTTWGASLSYLNAKGDGGASSPQILSDLLIPSNKEFSIFSAEKCDESCGFSRAKDIAHKGFAGANKVFLFHFKMPLDGERGFNGDMPALWALNARIPRTGQYSSCTCWTTGCGEADIYEVLAPGDTKCKSTFHLANGAGSSDYFERPVHKHIKVATVFHEKSATVSIKKLPDDFDFSSGLDDATVMSWVTQPTDGIDLKFSSLFQILS